MTSASIVVPVYNRANLVHRAIDSALKQTVPCEVIVVDHGSTDEIKTVVTRYGDKIRYIRREEDRGPVAAWIDGIRHAKGRYVHITYDDDWIQPDFVEACSQLLGPDVAFVYSRVRLHRNPSDAGSPSLIHPPGIRPVPQFADYVFRSRFTISPGAALFRREDALKNLLPAVPRATGTYGPGTGVGEDLLLFLLTSLDYPTYGHVPAFLADFLAHDNSITTAAIRTDRAAELQSAYDHARKFYLMQEGSHQPRSGLRRLAARLKWEVAAGSPGTRLLGALGVPRY